MMSLRIATYNIHQGVGRDGIKNPIRIADVIGEMNADIVALQEVTSHPEKSDDLLAHIAALTEMEPIEGFTLTVAESRYGNALLSSLPLSAANRVDISVKGREPRGVIEVAFNHNCQNVVLWATHLGLSIPERHQQIDKLLNIINFADADMSILLGDLNLWFTWDRPSRKLQQWFKPGHSPATFPAIRPFLKLDRILVRPADKITTIRTHATKLSRVASDHLPLVADIAL
jgi:endonuclease/exonuclease/phosphatase family metal-dependent hydrolase